MPHPTTSLLAVALLALANSATALPHSGSAPLASAAAAIASVAGGGSGSDYPPHDEIELVSGRKVRGHVVWEDADTVVVRKGRKETVYPRDEVARLDSTAQKVRNFLTVLGDARASDVKQLKAAALQARQDGLPDEETLAWQLVLISAPEDPDANVALGHERKNGVWLWRDGKRLTSLEKLERKHKDWGHAWELNTTHYHVRSNLELGQVLRAALDLERFYGAFVATFADLHIEEPDERFVAHLHADSASFPETDSHRKAYYTGDDGRRLVVDMSGGAEQWALFHEAVHQILHAPAVRAKAKGSIPDWVSEGLAEYAAAAADGAPGSSTFEFGRIARHHLELHDRANDPYELKRVLNLSAGDFMSSSGSALKYAQAYTLVAFCLDGAESVHRRVFLEYLRSSWDGQGSKKEFYRVLGIDEREFEAGWIAYVQQQALKLSNPSGGNR